MLDILEMLSLFVSLIICWLETIQLRITMEKIQLEPNICHVNFMGGILVLEMSKLLRKAGQK